MSYIYKDSCPDLLGWAHLCTKLRELSRFSFVREVRLDDPVMVKLRPRTGKSVVFAVDKELVYKLSAAFNSAQFIGNDAKERALIEIADYMVSKKVKCMRVLDAKAMVRNNALGLNFIRSMGLQQVVTIAGESGKFLELTKHGINIAKAWKNVSEILSAHDRFK